MGLHPVHKDSSSNKRQSIFTLLNQVMLQVEYHCFADLRFKRIDPLYRELCLIVAEVMLANPNSVIKINGDFLSAQLVMDVFSELRNHHIRLVYDNFQNVLDRVSNKKAYLRTSLYNAVFEYESSFC